MLLLIPVFVCLDFQHGFVTKMLQPCHWRNQCAAAGCKYCENSKCRTCFKGMQLKICNSRLLDAEFRSASVHLSPSESLTLAGFVLNKNGQCIFFLDANGVSAAVSCQRGSIRLRSRSHALFGVVRVVMRQVGCKDSGDSGDPFWSEKDGARRYSGATEVLQSLVIIIVALVP